MMRRYSWILVVVGLLAAGCAQPTDETTGTGEPAATPEIVEEIEEVAEEAEEVVEEAEDAAEKASTEVGKEFDEAVQSPDIDAPNEPAAPAEPTTPEGSGEAAAPEPEPASEPEAPQENAAEASAPAPEVPEASTASDDSAAANPQAEPAGASDGTAADALSTASVALTPANTKIQFVGTHTGDDPKPRTGTFGQFQGAAGINGGVLKSLQVEIDTASLTTDIDKLTNHLKSPDFFDVRQFPKANFQSTAVEPGADGTVVVKGNLTLLGETRPISFPAKVATTEGLSIVSEFTIDRTQFGMDYGLDNVEKLVTLTVTVGG